MKTPKKVTKVEELEDTVSLLSSMSELVKVDNLFSYKTYGYIDADKEERLCLVFLVPYSVDCKEITGKVLPGGKEVEIKVTIPEIFWDVESILELVNESPDFPVFGPSHARTMAFVMVMDELRKKCGSRGASLYTIGVEKEVEESWCTKDGMNFLVLEFGHNKILLADLKVKSVVREVVGYTIPTSARKCKRIKQ